MSVELAHVQPDEWRCAGAQADEPNEVHIRLIIHERCISDYIPMLVAQIAIEAGRCENAHTAEVLMRAGRQMLAVARVYEHMQTLELTDQVGVVRRVPGMCESLRACFEGTDASALLLDEDLESMAFPARSAFAAGGVINDVVSHAAGLGLAAEGAEVCLRLDHGPKGGRLVVGEGGSSRAERGDHMRMLRAFVTQMSGALRFDTLRRGTSVSVLLG